MPFLFYISFYLEMINCHGLIWSPAIHSHEKQYLIFIFSFKTVFKDDNSKDHWRFEPYMPIFLIPRTLHLSFWCGACSISAIVESNGKSQLAKYFPNSYALESYGG